MRGAFNPPLLSDFGAIGAGRRFGGGFGLRWLAGYLGLALVFVWGGAFFRFNYFFLFF